MIRSKVAKRYARALFSIGKEDGNYEKYGKELSDFVDFFVKNRDFREVISNPVFTLEERREILKVVLDRSDFSEIVKNFLNLLLEKDRIGEIEAIKEHYFLLTDEISNVARAEIITAMDLKQDLMDRLISALERMTSKKIKANIRKDPDIIGGVVVKIGDLILDGSVKAQIRGLVESF